MMKELLNFRLAKKLTLIIYCDILNTVCGLFSGAVRKCYFVGGPVQINEAGTTATTDLHVIKMYCINDWSSIRHCQYMLLGRGYLIVPFVKNIDLIVDVGANVGAAAVLFSQWYPSARIKSYEPCSIQFEALKNNAKELPNIEPIQCGLSDKDESIEIGLSRASGVANSIHIPINKNDQKETIVLRDVSILPADIDLLKVDTEGNEVPIFKAIGKKLSSIKVIYYEYHSEQDRVILSDMHSPSHVLCSSLSHLPHSGECCWVRKDLVPKNINARAIDRKNPLPLLQ